MPDSDPAPSSIRDDPICESSLNPNKSSGDIVERTWTPDQFWEFTEGRDGEFSAQQLRDDMEGVGLVIVPAAEIERLRREVEEATTTIAQLNQRCALFERSTLTAESAVAALKFIASNDGNFDQAVCKRALELIENASAIRAAGAEKTAESGDSPSTHNSESE